MEYGDFLRRHLKVVEEGVEELKCLCPFHPNTNTPAFSVNVNTGSWFCFAGCGGGSFATLKKRLKASGKKFKDTVDAPAPEAPHVADQDGPPKVVPDSFVQNCHAVLFSDAGKEAMAYLKGRGISVDVIKQFLLGYDLETARVTIPIPEIDGTWCNVKKYDWLHVSGQKFTSFGPGYGANRLWPVSVVEASQVVYMFEGEMDCLLAHSMGVKGACTVTSGAGSWDLSFTKAFLGKEVRVVYDIDPAGVAGANLLARKLAISAKSVVVGNLPITYPANGDFSDFCKQVQFDKKTIHAFLDGLAVTSTENLLGETLQSVVSSKAFQKLATVRAVVAGKDPTPFQVPAQVCVTCAPNMKSKICSGCPLAGFGGKVTIPVGPTSKPVVASILSPDAAVTRALNEHFDLPARCPGHKFDIVQTQPVWNVVLAPDLDVEDKEAEYVSRRTVTFANLPPNVPHDFKVYATSDPKTQESLLQIINAKSSQTALEAWELTKEKTLSLAIFHPVKRVKDNT